MKVYGMVYRETGKPHLAEVHLRQALGLAAGRDLLLEGEVQREMSAVLRGMGRNRESLAALNRAHALFTRLQARFDNDDVEQRIARLEEEFFSLVRQWGESIEAKDRYTSGHCVRVADYACRIAAAAGMAEEEMVWFRMGAFLHDVGKVDVPAEILNKPGRLTDEERAIIERHPVTGDEMISTVEFPWDVRGMVRWHHERWDGAGYPDRLAGDAVPLPARILRIADVFDALTSVRSYRPPMPPEHAFSVMEEDAGGFDPQLFEIFRALLPELAPIAANAHEEALLSQRNLRS
jgi:putative nucleotidyltransferase with HDIG domain